MIIIVFCVKVLIFPRAREDIYGVHFMCSIFLHFEQLLAFGGFIGFPYICRQIIINNLNFSLCH